MNIHQTPVPSLPSSISAFDKYPLGIRSEPNAVRAAGYTAPQQEPEGLRSSG